MLASARGLTGIIGLAPIYMVVLSLTLSDYTNSINLGPKPMKSPTGHEIAEMT